MDKYSGAGIRSTPSLLSSYCLVTVLVSATHKVQLVGQFGLKLVDLLQFVKFSVKF